MGTVITNTVSLTSPSPQWSSFIDLELDWKPYAEYPSNKHDQDTVLQTIIDAACTWIQGWLGRPVAPTLFQQRFDGWTGWDATRILLPYYPVLEVVSATEFWGNSSVHVLVEQTPEQQFGVGRVQGDDVSGDSDVYQLTPLTGEIQRTFPGLIGKPFFPGARNVEIVWWAGYNPIPADVKLAALELATWTYRNSLEDPRQTRQVGGYDEGRNELWPAVPNRVMVYLERFTQQGIG